jgi:hypothetical protein
VHELRPADQEIDRVPHCAEILADIDRVGDHQEGYDAVEQLARIASHDIPGDAAPGGPPDAGADLLDRRHHRVGQQHCPANGETELGSGLRIGRNSARIVVALGACRGL